MRLRKYKLETTIIVVVAVLTIIQAMSEDTSLTKTANGIGVILLAVISIISQEFWKKRKKRL